MEILQGVWKRGLRPRAVVGYGVKTFLPSPPNYVTRSPGDVLVSENTVCFFTRLKIYLGQSGGAFNLFLRTFVMYFGRTSEAW